MLFPSNTPGGGYVDPNARPDLTAQGNGTSTPYTSADGSAGMQAPINAFTVGGTVQLTSRAYYTSLAGGVLINKAGVAIIGNALGFNDDPNGEHEGSVGTKYKFAATGYRMGINGGIRNGGNEVARQYLWGSNQTDDTSNAILVEGRLDQPHFVDLNISNVKYGLRVTSGGNLDTPYFHRFNVLNASYGVYDNSNLPSFFGHLTDGCLSDLAQQAVALLNPTTQQFTITGQTLVRAGRAGKTSAVRLAGRGHIFAHNVVRDSGWTFPTDNPYRASSRAASVNGVEVPGNDCQVSTNQINSTATGVGVLVTGNRNRITNNSFSGALGDNNNGLAEAFTQEKYFSSNVWDIVIGTGAQDNVVEQTGLFTIQDNGIRTVINGMSKNAGDPNAPGDSAAGNFWGFIANKPEGLRLYDTVNDVLYEYRSVYPNGRLIIVTD